MNEFGTSHYERIMTAMARSKSMARSKAMARCNAKNCEPTDAKVEFGENFQGADGRAIDRESRYRASGPGCDCTRADGDRFDTLDWSRCS